MGIDFFRIFVVDKVDVVDSLLVVVDSLLVVVVDLDEYSLLVVGLVDDSLLVDKLVVVADELIVDSLVASSLMVRFDMIDQDSLFGDFDSLQLVMVGDIVQLDWVQLDYSHRSDDEDGVMVVDAEIIQKEILEGSGYMRKR